MRVITDIKVRGYHIDFLGHVNHARTIELLEEGRWQYMERQPQLVAHCHQNRIAHAVVKIDIDYRKPATLGMILQIDTEVLRATDHSVVMLQTVTQKGTDTVVAQAEVTNVFLDAKTGKPIPLAGEIAGIWPDLGR